MPVPITPAFLFEASGLEPLCAPFLCGPDPRTRSFLRTLFRDLKTVGNAAPRIPLQHQSFVYEPHC